MAEINGEWRHCGQENNIVGSAQCLRLCLGHRSGFPVRKEKERQLNEEYLEAKSVLSEVFLGKQST